MEYKKWNGFLTVEASFILPMVLSLYLAVLSAALLLYNRCLISQDSFLLGLRGSRFTKAEESYGEVIYGCGVQISWQTENYVRERMQRKEIFYLGCDLETIECLVGDEQVIIRCQILNFKETTQKRIEKANPVTRIRERRKE